MTPLMMVSDDELLLAKALVRQAKGAGMRAFSDTSSRAPELAERYRPDVILLDINQTIDGRQLLADLKANEHTKDIPVVMITGVASETVRSHCLALGARDFVTKPFRPGFFNALAREAMAHASDAPEPEVEPVLPVAPLGRVLLVGTDHIYSQAASMLQGTHHVDRVTTVEQARTTLATQRYQVLVTDLIGTGAEGVQLVQWARTVDPILRGVLLGDSAQYAVAARLDTECSCTMLLKPYSLDRLADEIDRATRLAFSRRAPPPAADAP